MTNRTVINMLRNLLTTMLAGVIAGTGVGAVAGAPSSPVVVLESGRVSGTPDSVVDTFLGIPYAAPPIGALRWRAPQPVARWRGARAADRYGKDCMQVPYPSDAAPLGTTPAEDCLVVNVWRPRGTHAGARVPVLFWIYGGGEVNGGASPAVYSGHAFARDGVVFVSFNYRLGRFGFFGFPELAREDADHGQLTNYGAMDVIAALQWVRRNIAAFGGDPDQVTIYGQSAGAGMVSMLMTSMQARGLFARAIIQSGGGTWVERPPPQAAIDTGIAFAHRWGIEGTGAEALRKLRVLSAEQVADGIHIGTRSEQAATYTGPVTDGRIVPESLRSAAVAGRAAPVPLLIGSTTADNYDSIKAGTFEEALATTFAQVAEQARVAYTADVTTDPHYVVRQMGRDHRYAEPARFLAARTIAQGHPAYLYRYGYVAESMRTEWTEGPPHATDIPFAMETVAAKYGDRLAPADLVMAKALHAYWVAFVRTGNPNGAGLPQWPVYDPQVDRLMSFGADGIVQAIADPRRAQLDVVSALRAPRVKQP
jgi:para-nitrobenzyl esterase